MKLKSLATATLGAAALVFGISPQGEFGVAQAVAPRNVRAGGGQLHSLKGN